MQNPFNGIESGLLGGAVTTPGGASGNPFNGIESHR